jgi:hypothetical protein
MEVVCLQEDAFYALFDKVIEHIDATRKDIPDKWVDGDEAMALLNITSKTSLQKLRNERKIRFSQPQKKVILYDRQSLDEYLEQYVTETL